VNGGASRPAFPPPFKVHGHPIEAISELEQLLADLQKPRLPRELPDFFGLLTVVLRSRPLCVAHYGPPPSQAPRDTKPLSLPEGSTAHSLSGVIFAAMLPLGHTVQSRLSSVR
jgi:hypothetical protein